MKEAIIHPTHYKKSKYEVWDINIAFDLPYCLADAVKYIVRAGVKDKTKEVEDLQKAIAFIQREMERLRNNEYYGLSIVSNDELLRDVLADWKLNKYRGLALEEIFNTQKTSDISVRISKLFHAIGFLKTEYVNTL